MQYHVALQFNIQDEILNKQKHTRTGRELNTFKSIFIISILVQFNDIESHDDKISSLIQHLLKY